MKKLTCVRLQLIVRPLFIFILFAICYTSLYAQNKPQTQADSYTRYELLSPESQSFRIIYDVSATTAGNVHYFNTLRMGSEHKVDEVIDLMTGKPLKWEIVNGAVAKSRGHNSATEDMEYLMVHLARPVPENGEARIRIDKTYKDINSYFTEGEEIVFKRSLGIKRNALVLPKGYEIISCNHPSQVELESGGRIKLSFMNLGNGSVDYLVKAKKLPPASLRYQSANEPNPWADYTSRPEGRDKSKARLEYTLNERAYQNREIVYFPLQPETHSFRLYHDYTESREGIDKYLNVVRAGSKASNPSAYILDTGEKLKVETLVGKEITDKGIDLGSPLENDTEVIVIWFDAVKKGYSTRLRIEETYTDPNRYLLYNNELVWDRSFGRNRNTVVLPEGWWLTTNAIPAIIDQTPEGQPRLYYVNDRPDNVDVLIKARRR